MRRHLSPAHPERSAPRGGARSRGAWIALALLAAGCQDYNFNPVGHCLLQPGSERITLDNLSTADILFVVDDSGSMEREQADLAANFTTFVNTLNQVNVDRNADGLDPLDFHIAITSTSVFSTTLRGTCAASCGGLTNVCCTSANTVYQPAVYCQSNDDCSGANVCRTGCFGATNDFVCCSADGQNLERRPSLACDAVGEPCGDVKEQYRAADQGQCIPGVAPMGQPFPQGDFLAAPNNPKVISFEKALYPATGPDTAGIAQRIAWFQDNIEVGTCGSGQEQALEAARLALKKAFRRDGLSQPGVTGFPHEDAKLVVVFVGDEDDCSSPKDDPLILRTISNHNDSCVQDTTRRFPVNEYADFLDGLGRPYSAAFIESSVCSAGTCTPNVCCQDPSDDIACDGSETPGTRFAQLATELRRRGRDVVEGSICSDFGMLLGEVAELVKPPDNLVLPTQPASTDIAILRVVREDGATRTTCNGPAPAGASEAERAGYDWWFVAAEGESTPSEASRFVVINHGTGRCEANPGETYSADYLGVVPAGGCADATECATVLGGDASAWLCEGADAGTGRRGTCLCQ